MAIRIDDIKYSNNFRPEEVQHPLANILEAYTLEIEFRVENFVEANADQIIQAGDNVPNQLTDDWFYDVSGRFQQFVVGDEVTVTNAGSNNGTYTIVGVIGTTYIRVDASLTAADHTTATIENTTTINGITYRESLIENTDATNFQSLETGQDQEWTSDEVDATNVAFKDLVPQGGPEWQIGSVRIQGLNIVGVQAFRLEISSFIHPFFLAGQINDLLNGIAPPYLRDANSLKNPFEIQLHADLSDPNRVYSITIDDIFGNVGWFDEKFNGDDTNYVIAAPTYQLVSDLSSVTTLQLSQATRVTINVQNTTDSPFIDHGVDPGNATRFEVNFVHLPQEVSQYTNNGQTLEENFLFDYADNLAGFATPSNGDKFGTLRQAITNYTVDFVSSSEVNVIFDIDLGATASADLLAKAQRYFLLAVNVQDSLLATAVSDRVQLLADVQQFFFTNADPGVLTYGNNFLVHPQNDIDEAQVESCFLPEDIVVARSLLQFDVLDNTHLITSVTTQIIAKNTADGRAFVLDSLQVPFDLTNIVSGGQYIEFNQPTQFIIPQDQIRAEINLLRRLDLDSGTVKAYMLQYPFAFRWEYWIANASVDNDFFDAAEPHNGKNQEWNRFNVPVNWGVYLRVITNMQINGEGFSVTNDTLIDSRDYDESADWNNNSIKMYDVSSGLEMVNGPDALMYSTEETRIEAEFEYVAGTPPALVDIWAWIRVEVYEEGGRFGTLILSSVYETDGNTWLKTVDAVGFPGKVKVTKVGAVYTLEALVDHTKLPAGKLTFAITARIGIMIDPNCILTEDGIPINLEDDSDCIEIES